MKKNKLIENIKFNYKQYLIIIIFLLPRTFYIFQPINDMQEFRQTQTAMVAKNILISDNHFLVTYLNLNGKEPAYLVQEFPIYQGFVAVLSLIISDFDLSGRIISLLFSILQILFIYKITKKYFEETVAFYCVLFISVIPIHIFLSTAFMVNMMAYSLTTIGLYYLMTYLDLHNFFKLLLSSILFSISILIYPPIIVPLGPFILYLFYCNYKMNNKVLNPLLFFAILIIPFIIWNKYSSGFGSYYIDSSKSTLEYFFGIGTSRFDLILIRRIVVYFLVFVVGIHGVILLSTFILFLKKMIKEQLMMCIYLLFGGIIYYLMFFLALSGHNYYFLPLTFMFAIFSAIAYQKILSYLNDKKILKYVFVTTITILILIQVIPVLIYTKTTDDVSYNSGREINKMISKNDLVITLLMHRNYTKNAIIHYFAERKGWSIETYKDNTEIIKEIDSLRAYDAKYLIYTYDEKSNHLNVVKTLLSYKEDLEITDKKKTLKNILTTKYKIIYFNDEFIIFEI